MAAISSTSFSFSISSSKTWNRFIVDNECLPQTRLPQTLIKPYTEDQTSKESCCPTSEKLSRKYLGFKLSLARFCREVGVCSKVQKTRKSCTCFSEQNLKNMLCQTFTASAVSFPLLPRSAEAAQEFLFSLPSSSDLQSIIDASKMYQSLNNLELLRSELEELVSMMLRKADFAMNVALTDIRTFSSFGHFGHAQFGISSFPFDSLRLSATNALGQIGTATLFSTFSLPLISACFAALISSTVLISASSSGWNQNVIVVDDTLPLKYSPQRIEAYFRRRPHQVLLRFLRASIETSSLIMSILIDISFGRLEQNKQLRAAQFLERISRLGPTAIKIGQALSIRPDILPKAYIEELQKLQDKVPPFSNDLAMNLVAQGLGKPAAEFFSYISDKPVAAASLGQVYKAVLQGSGETVAVKVQRPEVLESVSLDIYILRLISSAMKRLPFVHTDFVDILDNWAVRFFNELDYVQEANNAVRFAKDMQGLSNVTVPKVFKRYTTQKVLITAWVEGEKLSESASADLLPLISTALNCYLVQLLESGFLHADPHPGNLLRTPDGRLCVLDFGLMTEITEDQRYTLVEYIAHLMNSDYARVAEDLIRLGFVPAKLVDPLKTAAIIPQLGQVLGQLVQGGGARKINMQQVTDGLMKISRDYVFVIPPYFALILRAFSVLEGIGLEADPDYAIVVECTPYLSKRLLTDDSPRTRAILEYFLYAGQRHLDVQRLEAILSGFNMFRDSMAKKGNDGKLATPVVDPTSRKALSMLFAPEGSYIQELLLTELVRMVDALSRGALAVLWGYSASTFLLPLRDRSWLFPIRGWIVGVSRAATLSEEDIQSLEMVRRLLALLQLEIQKEDSRTEFARAAQGMMPIFWDLVPGCTSAAQRFIIMLVRRQALRLADDLDGRKSITSRDEDPFALVQQAKSTNFLLPSTSRTSE